MNDIVDVFKLSEKVELDSESGALAKELLAKGETLYGVNPCFPNLIERISPDGKISLVCWEKGRFVAVATSLSQTFR